MQHANGQLIQPHFNTSLLCISRSWFTAHLAFLRGFGGAKLVSKPHHLLTSQRNALMKPPAWGTTHYVLMKTPQPAGGASCSSWPSGHKQLAWLVIQLLAFSQCEQGMFPCTEEEAWAIIMIYSWISPKLVWHISVIDLRGDCLWSVSWGSP